MWIRVNGQSHGQPERGIQTSQTSDVSHLTLDICHLSPYP